MNDEIPLMIQDCLDRESKLSEWEANFIADIAEIAVEYSLTEKQTGILNKIWERVTA